MSELKSLLLGCRQGIQFKAAGHHHSALATFVALATHIKEDLTPLPLPQRMLWGCLGTPWLEWQSKTVKWASLTREKQWWFWGRFLEFLLKQTSHNLGRRLSRAEFFIAQCFQFRKGSWGHCAVFIQEKSEKWLEMEGQPPVCSKQGTNRYSEMLKSK